MSLLPQHQAQLDASGISPEVAAARGYDSATTKDELAHFEEVQRRLPALMIPVHTVDGTIAFRQIRPDDPRKGKGGRVIKYETPAKQRMVIDVPPMVREDLDDPSIQLIITEGVKKADAAVSRDLCCIALLGVDCWKGTNDKNGKTALACWNSIALNGRTVYIAFDSDVMSKPTLGQALTRFKKYLESKTAIVHILRIPPGPNGEKVGLDDYLVGGGDLDALVEAAQIDRDFEPLGKLTEPLDDIGDAMRFAALYRDCVAWSPHLGQWLVFEMEQLGSGRGGRWVEDVGEIEVMRYVKLMVRGWYKEALSLNDADRDRLLKHAVQCGVIHRLQNILKSARDVLAVDITTFDADDYLLNCRNGVLDLRTFTLRPAEPTDRCRWQADVEYVADYEDEKFMRFLLENIPNPETRAFYQELAGYILLGNRRLEIMGAAYGPKRSGKTTFAEMARKNLGTYAATVSPEVFMVSGWARDGEANRPMLASLVNKRLVTSPEGNKAHEFDVALVKQLTGGDPVNAMAKYKDPFSYVPKFFILLYGNHRPKAAFDEDALRRRLLELPFKVGHEDGQADETFKEYLLTDPSAKKAWLAWAVKGLQRLLAKNMKLTPPPEVTQATAEYWAEQNVLGPFVKKLVLDPDSFIISKHLTDEFDEWVMETGTKVTRADLLEWLAANGCENVTKRIATVKTRGWTGIRWARNAGTPGTPVPGNFPTKDSQKNFPESGVPPRSGVPPPPRANGVDPEMIRKAQAKRDRGARR